MLLSKSSSIFMSSASATCASSCLRLALKMSYLLRAGFWQAFAWACGASLKKEYDAEGTDRLTERVILLVESGQL